MIVTRHTILFYLSGLHSSSDIMFNMIKVFSTWCYNMIKLLYVAT